jgi:glycosyltransferase involved in cell wall biosynthesis
MLPIKIMRALASREIPVVIAYLKARRPWHAPIETEFEGAPLVTLSPPHWISGFRRLRKRFGFDLIHAQHYGGATRAYPASRLHNWPMVYEIHSLLGDEVERDRLGRDWKFHAYLALERRVFSAAAHVITLGEPVRTVVIEEKGVPAERASVIYPGIDLEEFDQPSAEVSIPGVTCDTKIIMYIGSIIHPNQGVPLLIEALPSVFRAFPASRCVLVGGPEDAAAAYREHLGPELAQNLIVLANRTPAEVVALARRADVLVHPRLACRENYSVQSKIAVYLAAGRPIVATNFGDYQKLLGQTGAGLLVDVDVDAIARGIQEVLRDPGLAARLAIACPAVAREHFAMDRNIDRYLDVYEQALIAGPQERTKKTRAAAENVRATRSRQAVIAQSEHPRGIR